MCKSITFVTNYTICIYDTDAQGNKYKFLYKFFIWANMKRQLAIMMFVSASLQVFAQSYNREADNTNIQRIELDARNSKLAHKEAKKLAKEGWLVNPGKLPLEKQLDRIYSMQLEFVGEGQPKWIFGEGRYVAQTYDAAKLHAVEMAKADIAGQLQANISGRISNYVENTQTSAVDAKTEDKMVSISSNNINVQLGNTVTILEVYRPVKKTNNTEVLVRIAYKQ